MYASTMTRTEEIREQFYADLDTELHDTSATDKLVILRDFNPRVGRDVEQWNGVMGTYVVGKMNSNGLLLLSKCAEHNLLITNTIFRLADKYKTPLMHPRSEQWHFIDYIIITRQRDSSDVLVTLGNAWIGVLDGPRAKFNIRIVPQHHKRSKFIRQAFNTARLLSAKYKREFQSILDDKFEAIGPLTGGPEEKWNQFKEDITETVKTVLGPK